MIVTHRTMKQVWWQNMTLGVNSSKYGLGSPFFKKFNQAYFYELKFDVRIWYGMQVQQNVNLGP